MSDFVAFPLQALKSLGVSTETRPGNALMDLQRKEITEHRETEHFETAWPK
jgi:hypothetical protein